MLCWCMHLHNAMGVNVISVSARLWILRFVSLSWAGLQVDLLFVWTVVLLQVLRSAQIAPAEVSWYQESNQKRSERGNSEGSVHESGQTQIRGCKLTYAIIFFFLFTYF